MADRAMSIIFKCGTWLLTVMLLAIAGYVGSQLKENTAYHQEATGRFAALETQAKYTNAILEKHDRKLDEILRTVRRRP